MNILTPFTTGLYTKFKTDATLAAALPPYPSGTQSIVPFFPGLALDGAPMPYVTYDSITATPGQFYGGNGPSDLEIQFTVTAIGFAAAVALADTITTVLDAWACPVALTPSGQITSLRRVMDPIQLLSDAEADADSNDVWDVKFSYGFTLE